MEFAIILTETAVKIGTTLRRPLFRRIKWAYKGSRIVITQHDRYDTITRDVYKRQG